MRGGGGEGGEGLCGMKDILWRKAGHACVDGKWKRNREEEQGKRKKVRIDKENIRGEQKERNTMCYPDRFYFIQVAIYIINDIYIYIHQLYMLQSFGSKLHQDTILHILQWLYTLIQSSKVLETVTDKKIILDDLKKLFEKCVHCIYSTYKVN